MTIDNRLRAAQKQQLHRVQDEVRRRGLDTPPSPQPRWPWFLTLAMAAAVVALVIQLAPRPASETVTTALSPSPEDGATTESTAAASSTSPSTMPATVPSTLASTPTAPSIDGSSPTAPASSEEQTPSTPTQETATAPTSSTTATATSEADDTGSGLEPGVPNQVCGTGFRAPLERAALRYVSEEQGWNRMTDLVDEQDGPYYFGLWEPDYPGTVSVEVSLDRPVRATEIRLAQHPFQDVSGTITIETAGQIIPIELSGRDGFRSHRFADPVVIDSFVITRADAASNITEVIICTE